MKFHLTLIFGALAIAVALVVGAIIGRSGEQPGVAPVKTTIYTSCREYASAPAKAGSVYYSYKGISINLPPGASCIMPDGAVFGAAR